MKSKDTNKIKALWIASWYPNAFDPYNGDFIQRHAEAVSNRCDLKVVHVELVEGNHKTYLDSISKNNSAGFEEHLIYVKKLRFPFGIGMFVTNIIYYIRLLTRLLRILNTYRPDILHVHVPVKAGIGGVLAKRVFKLPLVVTEHWGIYNDLAFDKYATRGPWFKFQIHYVFKNMDNLITVSKNLGNNISQRVLPVKFDVVYNVVDTTVFRYVPKTHSSKMFRWVHVSILNEPKNPFGLLEGFKLALRQLPEMELTIIGPDDIGLAQHVEIVGLTKNVKLIGRIAQAKVADFLREGDGFLLFSNHENMPCVIAEALCCGIPVVSSNVGGISEIINETNGSIVEPGDETAFGNAIVRVARTHFDNPSIANEAAALFGKPQIAEKHHAVYQKTLSSYR